MTLGAIAGVVGDIGRERVRQVQELALARPGVRAWAGKMGRDAYVEGSEIVP